MSSYTSGFPSIYPYVGLYVEKFNNVSYSDNDIWKLASGKNIEWYATVGSLTLIFGVNCTVTPDSIRTKGGSGLLFIGDTFRFFLTISM